MTVTLLLQAPPIHVDVFNTSDLKQPLRLSAWRHFFFFTAQVPSDLEKPLVSLGAPEHKGRDPVV